MKKINILSLFLLFFLNSCIKESSQQVEFIVENKSDYIIMLDVPNFYSGHIMGYNLQDTIFTINSNTSISYNHQSGFGQASHEPFDKAQNIIIYFNNTDSIVYYRDFLRDSLGVIINSSRLVESKYNPLKLENYSGGQTKKRKNENGLEVYIYTYIFTNEDFEEAVRYNSTMK